MHTWHIYNTFDQASKAVADYIESLIKIAIEENNTCHIVLPGGNTPKASLAYLAEKNLPWEKIHWYPGDERCYQESHEDRNDHMLRQNLWSRLSATNIHPMPAELGAEEGANAYRPLVNKIGVFDIVFLGVGEDGHTASLFPDNEALASPLSVVPVHNSPKPPPDRISLGITILKKAKERIILTGGEGKAEIIARIKSGEDLPVNRIGDVSWFIDKKSSGEGSNR
jgi:6-phosphogluconolactonase